MGGLWAQMQFTPPGGLWQSPFYTPFPYLGRSTDKGRRREGAVASVLVCLAGAAAATQQTLVPPGATAGGRARGTCAAECTEAEALGGQPPRPAGLAGCLRGMQRGPPGQLPGLPDSEACPPRPVWLCVEPVGWVTEKSWPALTSGPGGAGPLVPAGDVSSGGSETVLS